MTEVKRVIVGEEGMLERLLVALLAAARGRSRPGQTLTVKTVADVRGGMFGRLRFTPDLVPAELVGTRIYRPDTGSFDTELGPVFCDFLLADEINRAPRCKPAARWATRANSALTPARTPVPGRPGQPAAAARDDRAALRTARRPTVAPTPCRSRARRASRKCRSTPSRSASARPTVHEHRRRGAGGAREPGTCERPGR